MRILPHMHRFLSHAVRTALGKAGGPPSTSPLYSPPAASAQKHSGAAWRQSAAAQRFARMDPETSHRALRELGDGIFTGQITGEDLELTGWQKLLRTVNPNDGPPPPDKRNLLHQRLTLDDILHLPISKADQLLPLLLDGTENEIFPTFRIEGSGGTTTITPVVCTHSDGSKHMLVDCVTRNNLNPYQSPCRSIHFIDRVAAQQFWHLPKISDKNNKRLSRTLYNRLLKASRFVLHINNRVGAAAEFEVYERVPGQQDRLILEAEGKHELYINGKKFKNTGEKTALGFTFSLGNSYETQFMILVAATLGALVDDLEKTPASPEYQD